MTAKGFEKDALVRIGLRNQFYIDGHRKTIVALLLSFIVNVIMVSLLLYIITHPPAPRYFATSVDGRITPIYPLNQPNQSISYIKQWATKAAVAAFSYNFVNWNAELQSSSGFFTGQGWSQFQRALQQAGILDMVKANKLIVSAEPTAAPTLIGSQVLSNNVYGWQLSVPIRVEFRTSTQLFRSSNFTVTMLIIRVSTLNSPSGIGIQQFLVEQSGTGV